jgi:hypothetical protein
MILCKDCKHYRKAEKVDDDLCMANASVDLIRGELYSDVKCISERDPRRGCRPQGLNFVPLYDVKVKVLTNRKK